MRTVADMLRLDGRVALVTGGAGHVGLAIVEALLEQGATVILSDVDAAACEERRRAFPHRPLLTAPCDLSCEAATRSLVEKVLDFSGRLDVLVHNAAFVGTTRIAGWAEPFERQTLAAWRAAMAVNCDAAFVLAQATAAALRARRGSILLIGSIYGVLGPQWSLYDDTAMVNPAAYGASKGGLLQLMRYLATALPPVRVNAISPGGIERGQDPVFCERYRARTPLGRMATEEDLKGAVAYLASDAAAYVTGQNLLVDGGWSAW